MIEISRWGCPQKEKKNSRKSVQEPLERAGEEVVIVHPNPLTFGDWIPRGVSSCMDFGMLRLGVLLVDISQVRFAAAHLLVVKLCP